MNSELFSAICPVCSHGVVTHFFTGGDQPLATLAWPDSAKAAQAMPKYPHNFVQCPNCSHVWNRSFTYEAIPYENNPNRMFNKGGMWKGHLATTRDLLLKYLPDNPTVVDIGCGEGHFVRGLAETKGGAGRFVGFDPNATHESGRGVEFHAEYFEPLKHMSNLNPDMLTIRHVLEHLTQPALLLEQMAWGAAELGKQCWLFAEVPCIDRVFESGRLADFFYEHASHFTTESFRKLMERAGEVIVLEHGYDGEVVYALVRLGVPTVMMQRLRSSQSFARGAIDSRVRISEQLDALASSGQRVAIWGGTGKAAAFIHQFGADATRFPLVVDSDPDKAGTFVPGMGQEIVFRDVLKDITVDVVIIPTQWRAKDIAAEMIRESIVVANVLIEHGGQLIDFHKDAHPYR